MYQNIFSFKQIVTNPVIKYYKFKFHPPSFPGLWSEMNLHNLRPKSINKLISQKMTLVMVDDFGAFPVDVSGFGLTFIDS